MRANVASQAAPEFVPITPQPLNSLERRAIGGLSAIFAFRLLGLFLILPVFALYAQGLRGQTAFLVGLGLGAYGLTQALLQIPLGMLSDRLGRKPVIAAGLLVFCLGSVIAAVSDSIWGVIVGRALQGMGAIAAVVLAMVADLTREEQRTKAMLLIGVTIGASFVVALLLGPVLDLLIGVRGIFWLTAVLAAVGMLVLTVVPTPVRSVPHRDTATVPSQFAVVLANRELLHLDIGIFILHAVLTAMFVVVPLVLVDAAGLPPVKHWWLYGSAMLLSLLVVVPAITFGDRVGRVRRLVVTAVLALVLSQALLLRAHQSTAEIWWALLLFFAGFNVLEAELPSLVSKAAPVDSKGTAIGVYSSFEFFGAFAGAAGGGWLHGRYGITAVFALTLGLSLVWLLVALAMREPRYMVTRLVQVGRQPPLAAQALARELRAVPGVAEAVVIAEEGVAYLKIDTRRVDEEALKRFDVAR